MHKTSNMNAIYEPLRVVKNLLSFTWGYSSYKRTKVTPKYAYSSMRQLFCQTNGQFNEFVAKLETSFRPKYEFKEVEGILGNLDQQHIKEISEGIKQNGYFIFPQLLSPEKVQQLVGFARHTPAIPRMTDDKAPATYSSENPISPIYDFRNQTLFESKLFQSLLTDESMLAVAQEYLGNRPMLDLVAMWWSTANVKNVDLSKSAQLYHFDLDRIKFLKFFIYLSDVDSHNGPHCYIEGSHKLKPKAVRRDGRILDEELTSQYAPDSFKEIIGKAGTILAVDTSGFHKGKPLESGERLLFQMEFATSMFGQYYPPVQKSDKMDKDFLTRIEKYKQTFSEILK
jgi:hypothetical protein